MHYNLGITILFISTLFVRNRKIQNPIIKVGIYRVSGSSADMVKLRKAYESNPYEAEQLLKVNNIKRLITVEFVFI